MWILEASVNYSDSSSIRIRIRMLKVTEVISYCDAFVFVV